MPSRFAVLIGVNTYPAGNSLRAPVNDVGLWHRGLVSLGFDPTNIQVLASTTPDGVSASEPPDSTHVDTALTAFVQALKDAGDGAQGFVFFAGHGDLRARAWSSLFCSDYTGDIGPGDAARVASNGILHLERLRARVAHGAPRATLVAVIDACRMLQETITRQGPVEGIEEQWSQDRLVLLTAAQIGEESYERKFIGTWHGQLTWALTTLLDQWQAGREEGGRYVEVSFADLVSRANELIHAISPANQPQHPGLYASEVGKRTAVFHLVGHGTGVTHADPKDAPGHEWDPNTTGVIWTYPVGGGAQTIGWFRTNASGDLFLMFNTTPPDGTASLGFTVQGAQPTGVTSTWSAPATTPVAPGVPPAPLLVGPNVPGTFGLSIGAMASPWTWNWYLPPLNGKYVLPNSVKLASGALLPVIPNLKRLEDSLTSLIGPWGGATAGQIYQGGTAIGSFAVSTTGALTVTFSTSTVPSLTAPQFVVMANPTVYTALVLTAPAACWTWQSGGAPVSQMLVNGAARTIGMDVQNGSIWTFYANAASNNLSLPQTLTFTGFNTLTNPSGSIFAITYALS